MSDNREPRQGALRWTLLALAVAGILLMALGWWHGETSARREDAEMRDTLLRQALEIAAAINPQLAGQLTFTAEDQGTVAFERIREHLLATGRTFPNRGLFTMSWREGEIFFGPETYPPNSPLASSPGTADQQPAAEFFRIFADRRPVTVGPTTDEFGSFVSAAAPVFDSSNGEALMAVGVDVAVEDWQARLDEARGGPRRTTVELFLLMIVGSLLVLWRIRHRKSEALKVVGWLIALAALAMLGGLAFYGVYKYRDFKETTGREMRSFTQQTKSVWNHNTTAKVQLLESKLDYLDDHPALRQAWQDRDLSTLTALAQPMLVHLKRKYGITHLYFIAPDRTCFLRAHQPDRRGDALDHFTVLTAERTGEDAWGREFGPAGAFTLRYVRPWKQDGQTIGYLELGMEAEHCIAQLAGEADLGFVTAIRKAYTTREQFESGRPHSGFAGAWDDYPDLVVAHRTVSAIPAEVADWLAHRHQEGTGTVAFTARQDDRTLSCGVIHLPDVTGRNVVELIAMQDITTAANVARSSLVLNLALVGILFGSVLALLWSVTGIAERQLNAAFAQMRESEARYRTIFTCAAEGILVAEVQTRQFLFANPAICRMLGYSEVELTRLGVADVHPQESLARAQAEFEACVRGEKTLAADLPCRRKDGAVIFVDISATPILVDGRACLVGFFTDITERKRVAEARRRAEEQHREMIENIFTFVPEGLLVFSDRMRQVRQNEAFRKIVRGYAAKMGYTEAELERLILEQIVPGVEPGVEKEIRIPRKNEAETTTQ